MKTDTPETDSAEAEHQRKTWQSGTHKIFASELVPVEFAQKLERERDDLRTALREMVAAKGRYNTQTAMEALIALVPDIQPTINNLKAQ
jgi:hypothetical protein